MENNNLQVLQNKSNQNDVVVAFFIRDNKLLIGLRNYKAEEWKDISVWTTPGGGCENNEIIKETLRRKILQETGITEYEVIRYLGCVTGARGYDKVYVFQTQTNQDPNLMMPKYFSEWIWCPINEIPDNFINPKALELLKTWILKGEKNDI